VGVGQGGRRTRVVERKGGGENGWGRKQQEEGLCSSKILLKSLVLDPR